MSRTYETEGGHLTITDLITILEDARKDYGDIRVLVDGYESGYNDVRLVAVMPVVDARDDERPWEGTYQDADYADGTARALLRAVAISR